MAETEINTVQIFTKDAPQQLVFVYVHVSFLEWVLVYASICSIPLHATRPWGCSWAVLFALPRPPQQLVLIYVHDVSLLSKCWCTSLSVPFPCMPQGHEDAGSWGVLLTLPWPPQFQAIQHRQKDFPRVQLEAQAQWRKCCFSLLPLDSVNKHLNVFHAALLPWILTAVCITEVCQAPDPPDKSEGVCVV